MAEEVKEILHEEQPSTSKEKLKEYIKENLPAQQFNTYDEEIKKRFPLHKNIMLKINKQKSREKSNLLTSSERRSLNLYNFSKTSMKYKDFLQMNNIWNDYACKSLQLNQWNDMGFKGDPCDKRLNQIASNIFKIDLHGSNIRIVRAKCLSFIGLSGIVVLESKHTFRMIGTDNRLRTIPKAGCVIAIRIKNFQLTLFGPNFEFRPAERSVRKIKTPLNIWL